MHTKQLWMPLGIAGLAVGLYGQVSSRSSYQELKEENEQLHSQLAEIHSEAEDAQGELATLKSDIDDVQTYASQCDDCDEVQSAAWCPRFAPSVLKFVAATPLVSGR
jgi:hypothetical protein